MFEEGAFREALRSYTAKELCHNELAIEDDTELLVSGLLDSLAVAQLLEFVEAEVGVTIPAGDLVVENFCSVDAIVAYLTAAS